MVDFRITNEHSPAQVAEIVDFLRKPRLWIPTEKDYPSHGEWLEKTEAQICEGKKRAMTAYRGRIAVGAVIYQRHPSQLDVLEIRNISVSPEVRNRYIGAFLLRNAEIEARENDFPEVSLVSVDTKLANTDMLLFLHSQGYEITDIKELYASGYGLDAILSKRLL